VAIKLKNILIFGCGNIGFETARLLLQNSYNYLFIIDCCMHEHLNKILGNPNICFIHCDALDSKSLIDIYKKYIIDKGINIDVLISTVGVSALDDPVKYFNEFEDAFNINFFGCITPIHTILSYMVLQKKSHIIIISSTSGHHAGGRLNAYAPSKWALENFCSSLRFELRPYEIPVDVICPTTIKNKYSKTFLTQKYGIESKKVAQKINNIIQKPKGTNHYIPGYYKFVHLLERVFPYFLNLRYGLKSRFFRKKFYKEIKINNVLITGASSNLGKELALLYSQRCNNLYLVAEDIRALNKNYKDKEIVSNNCNVIFIQANLSVKADIDRIINSIPKIDLLINNNCIHVVSDSKDMSLELYRKAFNINFLSPAYLISKLLAQGKYPKKIVNILSTTAIAGKSRLSCYSSTKAALWCFSRSLRREYGNKMHVIEFFIPPAFNSKRVAKRLIKAELKGEEVVYVPLATKIILVLEAFFPYWFRIIFK